MSDSSFFTLLLFAVTSLLYAFSKNIVFRLFLDRSGTLESTIPLLVNLNDMIWGSFEREERVILRLRLGTRRSLSDHEVFYLGPGGPFSRSWDRDWGPGAM